MDPIADMDPMMQQLVDEGQGTYHFPCRIKRGPYAGHIAHIAQMAFTVGLMVSDAKSLQPITRWCYPGYVEALRGLVGWDGQGDPPGPWIKQKPPDRRNPLA